MTNLTPKQERFAQVYVETSNASEAYRQAYDVGPDTQPQTVWVNACKVLGDTNVAQRVAELKELHVERHKVTVDSLSEEYEQARTLALQEKQTAAAVSATTGKAKLYGFHSDKIDHVSSDGSMSPKPVVIELVGVAPSGSDQSAD